MATMSEIKFSSIWNKVDTKSSLLSDLVLDPQSPRVALYVLDVDHRERDCGGGHRGGGGDGGCGGSGGGGGGGGTGMSQASPHLPSSNPLNFTNK